MLPKDHAKPLINLTLGEPTPENGYPSPDVISASVIEVIESKKHNGYSASNGALVARQAVVDKYSTEDAKFTADEVIITAGCSGALYTALSGLLEVGDNLLMPRPSFPLAKTMCENLGVEV